MEKQLQQFLATLLKPFLLFTYPAILILLIIAVTVLIKKNKKYKSGAYYQITKLPYFSVRHDTGRFGEYLVYKYLKKFEAQGAKFLFNIYIPKENGETTEIDVLMLCSKGIFVFESKNYSGWIFGSESQKNWYQTLPAGRGKSHKEHFYNPIMQNRSHIKHLEVFLGDKIPMRSIITFSDRCTLKNVQIKSSDVSVINRYNVYAVVSEICNQIPNQLLSDTQINELYDKLYPYTQVDNTTKAMHIVNIKNKSQPKQDAPHSDITIAPIQIENEGKSTIDNNSVSQDYVIKETPTNDASVIPEEKAVQQHLKCPKCGANLILRTATKGKNIGKQFYGCSNYPKCRYIQNIPE